MMLGIAIVSSCYTIKALAKVSAKSDAIKPVVNTHWDCHYHWHHNHY